MDAVLSHERGTKRPRTMNSASTRTKATATWHLYPSQAINAGDEVYIRSKSAQPGKRGRVEQVLDQRAVVCVQNHSTNVALKRLVHIQNSTKTTIALTKDTRFYRHLAESQVCGDDCLLEIGCSTGQASAIILKSTHNWIGLDVSKNMVHQTKEYLINKGHSGNVESRVFRTDVLVDSRQAESLIQCHFGSSGPSVVFIDIGGNRDSLSCIRVLQWCISTYSPRLVVIKNEEMVDECCEKCRVGDDGAIVGAHDWFQTTLAATIQQDNTHVSNAWPEHPLQAGMVVSPADDKTPICRYHNYHDEGCKKAEECPFDHDYCHLCRRKDHVAKTCPMRNVKR